MSAGRQGPAWEPGRLHLRVHRHPASNLGAGLHWNWQPYAILPVGVMLSWRGRLWCLRWVSVQ